MPALNARVRNLSSLQAKVKRLDRGTQQSVIAALRSLSGPIKRDIKSELSRPKSGPLVRRYRPSRMVKVSNPYEAPAKDRGRLVRSINTDVDPSQFNLTISAAAPYARELEYGTRRMLPRPFLRPALARWRKRIIDEIHRAIREGLSRG